MPVIVRSDSEWSNYVKPGLKAAVVVDFYADWCGPCRMIAPEFERLSKQYPNVTFLKVDVDACQGIAANCGVRAMPTFQAYFDGQKIGEVVGADKNSLLKLIETANSKAESAAPEPGRKLGGEAPAESDDDRRERMAAAAEARATQ